MEFKKNFSASGNLISSIIKYEYSKSFKRSNSVDVPAILFISVHSDTGGGQKHLYDLVSFLIKLNPDWKIIIASPTDAPYGSKFQDLANSYIPIPTRKWSFIAFIRLLRKCKKENINLIHSHGRGAGFYSRLLGPFGFKVVHTFHGIHFEPNFQGKVKVLLDRLLCPLTDIFICVSNDERRRAVSINICRNNDSVTIYNGIDIKELHDQVKNANQKEDSLREFKVPSGSFVLGTLARLNYQKGIDLLILTFKELVIAYPDKKYFLLIAGEGEERKKILSLIQKENMENNVKLLGNISNVPLFLSSLDCYVSSARWEGMPLSLIEAMSTELPCVVSNVIGNRELITQSQNGFIFELNEPDGFCKAVTTLEQSASLRKNTGFKAYQHVLKNHSLEEMTLKTTEVYKKI